jgi:hypothetical protein
METTPRKKAVCNPKILRKITSDYAIRILSCNIMLLVILSTFLRFSHFGPVTSTKDEIDPVTNITVAVVTETPVTY